MSTDYKIGDWVVINNHYKISNEETSLIIGKNYYNNYILLTSKYSISAYNFPPRQINNYWCKNYNINSLYIDSYFWCVDSNAIIKKTTKPKCKLCKHE